MGGLAKVSLFVNQKEKLRLRNEEEQLIVTDQDHINIAVKQWFLGSKEVRVTKDSKIVITINSLCMALFLIATFILFLAGISEGGNQQLIFSSVGFVLMIITIIYAWKSYFILQFTEEEDN